MTTTEIVVGYTICAAGAFVVLMHWWRAKRIIRDSIQRSSRFPLFAVRDLIRRRMFTENVECDPAWQTVHLAINHVLDIENRDNLYSFMRSVSRNLEEAKNDPGAAKDLENFMQMCRRRIESSKEFRDVLEQGTRAIVSMLAERTPLLGRKLFGPWMRLSSRCSALAKAPQHELTEMSWAIGRL